VRRVVRPAHLLLIMNKLKEILGQIAVQGDRLTDFKPNPGGQVHFCDAIRRGKKEIIFAAANDTGKTYLGLIMDAMWVVPEKDINGHNTGFTVNPYRKIQIPPEGIHGWISSESDKVQQQTIQPVFDLIFDKHIKKAKKEGGSYQWVETEAGRIDFMWQEMGARKYEGQKLHFAHLDEPHKKAIYRATQARMYKFGGTMWNTLTPVIDPESQSTMRDLMWMRDEIVVPYEKDPDSLPLVEIVYADLEENPYHDSAEIRQRNAGMSQQEKMAREKGRFVLITQGARFDVDMIDYVKSYIIMNPEQCTPQYGVLEYDPHENSDTWKVHFTETMATFSDKPESEDQWIIKIWQHPIMEQLGHSPGYCIGVDAAGNKRGDYTSVYVKRKDTRELVASLHGYIDEIELACQLWLLGHYYSDPDGLPAVVCIESTANNPGTTTLQYLITGISTKMIAFPPYEWKKIYHMPSMADLRNGVHLPADKPGFYTSAASREFLITDMRMSIVESNRALREDGIVLIKDQAFWDEADKFIQDKNGKYQAASGANDDRLFSSALADEAIKQGVYSSTILQINTNNPNKPDIFEVRNGLIHLNLEAIHHRPEEKRRKWI